MDLKIFFGNDCCISRKKAVHLDQLKEGYLGRIPRELVNILVEPLGLTLNI